MASSYSETILALLDELRSAAVSQNNIMADRERNMRELEKENERLRTQVVDLQRELESAKDKIQSMGKARSLDRSATTRGPLSKTSYPTRPLTMSQSVAEYERWKGASARTQNVSRSFSDSDMVPKPMPIRPLPSNGTTNGWPQLSQTPSSRGSSTSSVDDTAVVEAPERRVRRGSMSRSLDDSVALRPTGAFLKPSSHTSRHANSDNHEAWPGYVLSPDMEQKVHERMVADICRRYAGLLRTQRAARTIQHAYRDYRMKKRVQHLREVRASRLFTSTTTAEIMEGISHGNHIPVIRTDSFHRPLQRIAEPQQVNRRSQTISPAPSLVSNMSESMESIVGISEMVIGPELSRVPTDSSVASDFSSDASSIVSASPSFDDHRRTRGVDSGRGTASTSSSFKESPGAMPSGTPFEVVRRASFSTRAANSKIVRQRYLRIGITHFNRKPTVGIAYLIDKGLLNSTAHSVAVFLRKQGGLSRKMIGEYLGKIRNVFCFDVLTEFVELFDFVEKRFIVALRKFLSTFQISGEAQTIEAILQVFAQSYSKHNPAGPLGNPDTALILAFSIIMLNTDQHNGNVKHRMKKEDFIRNNRGIHDGGDLPRELLEDIYDEVKANEFRTAKDHVQQVLALENSISGVSPGLAQPSRQLVHVARMYEVIDKSKKQPPTVHSRFLFLFNDLLLVAKYASKKASWSYVFKNSLPLTGMIVEEFSNQYYKHGIQVKTNNHRQVMATFNGEKEETKKNFVRDLREVLAELVQMAEDRRKEFETRGSVRSAASLSPEVTRRKKQDIDSEVMISHSLDTAMLRPSPLDPNLVSIPEDVTFGMSNGQQRSSLPSSVRVVSRSPAVDHALKDDDANSIRSRSPTPSEQSEGGGKTWFRKKKKS